METLYLTVDHRLRSSADCHMRARRGEHQSRAEDRTERERRAARGRRRARAPLDARARRAPRARLPARSCRSAVASTGAWIFAVEVFGHPRPIFAPISAVVVLGLSVGRRLQRAFELALGVAVGLGIADLIMRLTGVGAWQIALIVLLSTSIAVLLGSGQLFASQAAISGILVATLPPPAARRRSGASSTRWPAGSSRSPSARSCCRPSRW